MTLLGLCDEGEDKFKMALEEGRGWKEISVAL